MNSLIKILVNSIQNSTLIVYRGKKQWMRPYLISLYKRRLEQGPEPERPRSMWVNWNYNGELYCFGKRLSEEFDLKILCQAFITKNYAELEKEKRKELLSDDDQDDSDFELKNQEQLVKEGDVLLNNYLLKLITNSYPLLPSDGHKCLVDHLSSLEVLGYIGSNLGLKDLIIHSQFPIPDNIICDTFKAVVATLDKSDSTRTENFIKDFVLVQMIGKDVEDIWQISNPMGLLAKELNMRNMDSLEPRILWATGSSTIMACYMVGIYCNKKLIGKGGGETLLIAEEMAARDSLNRLYGITLKKKKVPTATLR